MSDEHDTRECKMARSGVPPGKPIPMKCMLCSSPHAVSGSNCPLCRAAIDSHSHVILDEGPHFPVT